MHYKYNNNIIKIFYFSFSVVNSVNFRLTELTELTEIEILTIPQAINKKRRGCFKPFSVASVKESVIRITN